jgi:parvulin-like peptidyl-prolyl isomerase
VIDQASELGVRLSAAELGQQVRQFERSQSSSEAEFQKFLARTGETRSDIVLQAEAGGLAPKIPPKIEQDNQTVSQAQVKRYYDEHAQHFIVPEQRDLKIVRTLSNTAALRVKQEIQAGKSFAAVAKKTSIGQPIDTKEGLLLALVPRFFSEKPLNDAIFAATANILTGPVRISLGYYVFEVKAIRRAHRVPLTQVESAIRSQLSAEQRQDALSRFDEQFSKRWTARTHCKAGYVVSLCRQ